MANWFETEKVPFSWREWQKILNSSKGVHGGKDKRKDLSWQKGNSDWANKSIGTRMNFLARGMYGDKKQIAQVKCFVMSKTGSHEKAKSLKNKKVRWKMTRATQQAKFIPGKYEQPKTEEY